MTTNEYKFKVDITCEGCVNALKKSLTKTFGEKLVAVNADVQTQLVSVSINNHSSQPLPYDEVFAAVAKAGKPVTKLNGINQ